MITEYMDYFFFFCIKDCHRQKSHKVLTYINGIGFSVTTQASEMSV